jgi:hypothetical protein
MALSRDEYIAMLRSLSLLAGVVPAICAGSAAFVADDQEFLSKAMKGDISEAALRNLVLNENAGKVPPDYCADSRCKPYGREGAGVGSRQTDWPRSAGRSRPRSASGVREVKGGLIGAEFEPQFVAHMV